MHFRDPHKSKALRMSLENGRRKAQTGGRTGRSRLLCLARALCPPHPETETRLPSNDPQPPANVRLGQDSRISGPDAFKRYFSQREIGLSLGERSWADGAKFAVGPDGIVAIGSDCYLNDCILLAELEIRIGDHVMIGWNTTVSDSDFHPIAPAERIQDAIALSPLAKGTPRPPCRPQAGDHRR